MRLGYLRLAPLVSALALGASLAAQLYMASLLPELKPTPASLALAASYVLTSAAMVACVHEATKPRSNAVETPLAPPVSAEELEPVPVSGLLEEADDLEELLELAFEEKPEAKYPATQVKVEELELEPVEAGGLQPVLDYQEEEEEEPQLIESDVIETLTELEKLVEELKQKKPKPLPAYL